MTIEDNKQVAARFFELLSASDVEGALGLMTDDVTYWILGRRDVIPSSGEHSKKQMGAMFRTIIESMRDGMKMTVTNMIGEGDQVAMEAESYGKLKNGRVYNNRYHLLFTIRDGRIARVREYLDTQHVLDTWFK